MILKVTIDAIQSKGVPCDRKGCCSEAAWRVQITHSPDKDGLMKHTINDYCRNHGGSMVNRQMYCDSI